MFKRRKDRTTEPSSDLASQHQTSVPRLSGQIQQHASQQGSFASYTAASHGSASGLQHNLGQMQHQAQASASKDTPNPYKQPRTLGLRLEYPDTTEKAAHRAIDIIAIPGLSAYAPKTWYAYINGKDEEGGNVCWLSDMTMLPARVPDSRIMTYNWSSDYQGREVSQDRFQGEADTMLDRIRIDRQNKNRVERPIIFVCSCFGGLLLAKALVRASSPYHPNPAVKQIVDYTVGIVTLGTPFKGSWAFGHALTEIRIAEAQANGLQYSWELPQYLRTDKRGDPDANGRPSPLDDVVQEFTELIRHDRFKFPVVNFYETLPTGYNAFSKDLPEEKKPRGYDNTNGSAVTVPRASAIIDGIEQVGLDVRHNMMWKLNTPENDGFVRISSRIQDFVRAADQTLRRKADNQAIASLTVPRVIAEYLDAKSYSKKQKRLFTEKRSPGTCISHIRSDEFSRWRDEPRSTTLVCFGEPGVGKSVFFSVAVDHLQSMMQPPTSSGMAYIYFDYAELKQPPPSRVFLCSILKQLLMTSPTVPEGVSSLYNRLILDGTQPSESEAEQGIRDIARITPGKLFILLDALDECPSKSSTGLLSAIARLQQDARISVLITSRFNDSLEPGLVGLSSLQIFSTQEDIRQFVQENIGKVSLFLYRRASESLKSKIVWKILETSHGMFELARLQLWSLTGWASDEEVIIALAKLEGPGLHKSFRSSPQAMQLYEEAYIRTLERINTMPDGHPELARQALAWVLYSPVPLAPNELIHALAIKPPDRSLRVRKSTLGNFYHIQDVITKCVGLITVEGDSIRLAHFTAHQYLAKNISLIGTTSAFGMPRDLAAGLSLEDQMARQHLQRFAVCCIAYLSLDDFNSGSCADQAVTQRLQRFPFYRHAATHLGHYAQKFITQGDEDAFSVFVAFFGNDQKIRAASQVTRLPYGYRMRTLDYSGARGPLALHYATFNGLSEIAEFLLIQGGAKVSPVLTPEALLTATDAVKFTPLCWAAKLNDETLVALFLRYGAANPDHLSQHGPPALLANDSLRVLPLLAPISRSGAVDAMYLAVRRDDRRTVKMLLQLGVNPSLEVQYPGLVIPEYAGMMSKPTPSLAELSSRPYKPMVIRGPRSDSPIRLAKRTGSSHMCQILGIEKEHHMPDRWEPYSPVR